MPRAARLVLPVVVLAAVVAAGAYFLAHHPAPRTGDLPRPASLGAGATVYTTSSDILFDVDSASLHPEAIPVLGKIAVDIAQHPGQNVQVEGYTDDQGSDGYNLILSRSRAETVKAWLVHAGIAEDRIGATGFGEAYPVADNDSDAHRRANRRVLIVPLSPGSGAATASPAPSTVLPSGLPAGPRTRSATATASSDMTGGG